MIDRNRFDDFVAAYGPEYFVSEIIDCFLNDYRERMDRIRQQVSTLSFKELEHSVHSIRSASCNFWDPDSFEKSVLLEQKAIAANSEGLDTLYAQFETSMQCLIEELILVRKELTDSY